MLDWKKPRQHIDVKCCGICDPKKTNFQSPDNDFLCEECKKIKANSEWRCNFCVFLYNSSENKDQEHDECVVTGSCNWINHDGYKPKSIWKLVKHSKPLWEGKGADMKSIPENFLIVKINGKIWKINIAAQKHTDKEWVIYDWKDNKKKR